LAIKDLSPVDYHSISDDTLNDLVDDLYQMEERMSERLAGFDVDYSQGVLTLKLGPEHGIFVINKQPANKQIWFSSPLR
jgi:frataxin